MPQYRMIDTDGVEQDITCTIAEMTALKEKGWKTVFVPNRNSIISGRDTSGHGGGHATSDGWKDVLRRIRDNNPKSTIDV
jgi:hypothetical protein|tara:strand:+ start:795 stop:1034 length:240 start_codon:yes stop_codon:yes gene_type:complete